VALVLMLAPKGSTSASRSGSLTLTITLVVLFSYSLQMPHHLLINKKLYILSNNWCHYFLKKDCDLH
jgi:hypothetical protein